jgi:GT2 family glycosyltransferase
MQETCVSIIIVSYNTKVQLADCIDSIKRQIQDLSYEIIVSDNGSEDGSVEMLRQQYPYVSVIENNKNLGFGTANNRASDKATGKYILFLNSDTILLNNVLKIFVDFWESNECICLGALGCNLLDSNLEITHSWADFPKGCLLVIKWIKRCFTSMVKALCVLVSINYSKYRKKIIYTKKIGCVDYITGAALFVKNDNNCYFDEDYFLYSEETDLQKRMAEKGLLRMIIDGPQIIHLQGASDIINNDWLDDYLTFGKIQMDLSLIRYVKKNESIIVSFFMKCVLFLFWLNPLFLKRTKKYVRNIFVI